MFPHIRNSFGTIIIMTEINYEYKTSCYTPDIYPGVCQLWLESAPVSFCVDDYYLE